MKFKIAVFATLLAACAVLAANNTTVAGNAGKFTPIDVSMLTLFDTDITDACDSIGIDSFVVFGPYKLTDNNDQPAYSAFQAIYPPDGFTGGDSLVLEYQLTWGPSIGDTTAGYTAVDTATDTGERGTYTSIATSSMLGRAIIFKVKAIGDTQLIIKKPIHILFKKNLTYTKNM